MNITFRTPLLGSVADFCTATRIPLISNSLHLVELIVLLAKYREEGNPLFPEVYITTNVNDIIAMLPDAELLNLGKSTRDVDGLKRAIKKTAPLATGGWLVFIEDDGSDLNYGLFRGDLNPVAVMADTVLLDNSNTTPVAKVCQIAHDCVEIRSCFGEHHYIFLNHRKEESPPPLYSLAKLIDAICYRVSPELVEPTKSYLTRIFYNALRVSHGSLVAVTSGRKPPAKLFDDGIPLEPPVDFPLLIRSVRRAEVSPARLQSSSALLEGMLNSDGIIVFNNKGQLVGFNYFVRAKTTSRESGGARQRAFETLTRNLNKGLSAAFIQSQDGWSDYRGINQ